MYINYNYVFPLNNINMHMSFVIWPLGCTVQPFNPSNPPHRAVFTPLFKELLDPAGRVEVCALAPQVFYTARPFIV